MVPQTVSIHSTGSVPRLRVTRGPSSSSSSGALPPVTRSTDPKPADTLSYPDSQTTSEDETGTLGLAEATPRLLSGSLPPPDSTAASGDTAHRLRAVLDRFDTPLRSSGSRGVMPPSPSEPDSDFDVAPVQTARASIRVLLQNALREPGETPQKPKLARRASFNVVGSPKVSKSRRKSTSDEENEIAAKRHDERRSELSTAASLDRLRLQLTESMPSIQANSSSNLTSRPPSEENISTPKKANFSHHIRASKIPVSNTLVKQPKSHRDLEPFAAASENIDLSHAKKLTSVKRHHSHDTIPHESSRASSSQSDDADRRERMLAFQHETDMERERDWNRHHPPPPPARILTSSGHLHKNAERVSPNEWPTPLPPGTSPGSVRSPRQSLTKRESNVANGHSEDGFSSRGTSDSSNAEYRDRLKEAERERQHDLEQSWNRPRPLHSQSVPHSYAHNSNEHGYFPRPGSSAGNARPHSRVGQDAARASPSSSTSSHSHHEEQIDEEHERERNWNAPHPKWGQHPHSGPRTSSPIPPHPPGHGPDQVKVHSRHLTNSPIVLGLPEGGRSRSRSPSGPHYNAPRPHSRLEDNRAHDHHRTGSPSSSISSRLHQEEEVGELHERERNWNAPRPKWDQHQPAHHQAPGLETGHLLTRNASSHSLGNESIDKEREQNGGRHGTSSSLGVPTNGHSTRSISPISHSQRQPSSTSRKSGRSRSPSAHTSEARHPRPNSPLPPISVDRSESEDRERRVNSVTGWNSRKVSPSHRHERTPSSPSPVPSQTGPQASNLSPVVHSLSEPLIPARRSTSSSTEPVSASDVKKGHRRTTTELSDAMGPFPRKSKSNFPSLIAVPSEESDRSLFADESVPPPQMSTPTFKAGHLPDLSLSPAASDIPLPPSPSSPVTTMRDPPGRANSDLARLQRAVAPFTFPTRQPSPPETAALSTPSRRASMNMKQIEFRTPSPPIGLPDLPGSPLSDDDEAKTPIRPGEKEATSLLTMKTPHFPGAYRTPPLIPVAGYSVDGDVHIDSIEVETTPKLEPVDSMTKPQSLRSGNASTTSGQISLAVTPAPPGAYRATPAPRKGILKVRFDGEGQSSGHVNGTMNGVAPTTKGITPPPSPSSEDIPPLNLSPSRRKGLRLVDEYGRERRFTEDGEEIILDSRRKGANTNQPPSHTLVPRQLPVDDITMTPRRRAKMRQVDSLGNEFTEERKQLNGVTKVGTKAVFSRLTRSLGELQDDLAEEEEALAASMPQSGSHENERLMDLAIVSKAARVERNKLVRKLQLERHAEGGIADKVVARNLPHDLSSTATSTRTSWWRRKWRVALALLILELVILFMGYWLASIHAKQAWLATHFDPFFPALYLRKSPPSFISQFSTLPVGWSAFAISGTVRRVGVRGFVENIGKRLWQEVWSWRMEPWETWGSPAAGPPVPQPWPPS